MQWKAVEGYEGYYEVSDTGLVRSLDREIISRDGVAYHRQGGLMKQTKSKGRNGDGYFVVNLRKHHTSYVAGVHTLVAKAFIPNHDNLPTVNHKDGDKENNCVSNLEWATYSENNTHALQTGLRKPRGNMVAQYTVDGDLVAIYPSGACAARQTGISNGAISHCLNHRTKTAGGFIWKNVLEGQTTIPQGSTPGDELLAEAQEELGL